jgi:peptidoglycan/LPS O-acetylase OafA/YrhL
MRIRELDGVRGIAICLVIACHYEVFARQLFQVPQFGWVGVDIFFVLSGFLITSVLLNLKGQTGAFRTFYHRRFLRIFPPYFMALFAIVVAALLAGDKTLLDPFTLLTNLALQQSFQGLPDLISRLRSAIHYGPVPLRNAVLLPNFAGLIGGISGSTGVLWSLSIEEYFYLLWAPIVLWLKPRTIIQVAVTICVGGMFVRWYGFMGRFEYFSIFYRFDSLIFGALIALLPPLRKSWSFGIMIASTMGLGAILLSIHPFLGLDIRESPLFMAFGLSLICSFVAGLISFLVTTSEANTPVHKLLRFRPLTAIGTISYTLYLIHAFVYLTLLRWFRADIAGFAAVPLSFGLAALSWIYIEKPILSHKQREAVEISPKLARTAVQVS